MIEVCEYKNRNGDSYYACDECRDEVEDALVASKNFPEWEDDEDESYLQYHDFNSLPTGDVPIGKQCDGCLVENGTKTHDDHSDDFMEKVESKLCNVIEKMRGKGIKADFEIDLECATTGTQYIKIRLTREYPDQDDRRTESEVTIRFSDHDSAYHTEDINVAEGCMTSTHSPKRAIKAAIRRLKMKSNEYEL